jgi:hypothetical protein
MSIKYEIKQMAGLKVFIESLVLLFAWVLVIYC